MTQKKKTVRIYTLGCRANQYESDAMAEKLEKAEIFQTGDLSEADLALVNTCAVTGESVRKCGQLVRRIVSIRPELPIVVAGCWAQIEANRVRELPGVRAVIGNTGKDSIDRICLSLLSDPETFRDEGPSPIKKAPYDGLTLSRPRRTRSYIKIEDGCDRRCAYCTIPLARGPIRSKPEETILGEVRALAEAGCEEFILTGIETSAYGRDTMTSLSPLLWQIDKIPGVRRIGLGSLDPTILRGELLETFSRMDHLLPHLHLSVQSGSTTVLRRMRRPYSAEGLRETIANVRKAVPEVFLTADVITGFPGETEEEFQQTADFVLETRFLHVHVFPFSARKGTEASRMGGQVPAAVRHERAARLSALQGRVKEQLLSEYTDAHREKPVYVLVEERKNGRLFGHSEHYAEIYLEDGDDSLLYRTVPATLISSDKASCLGRICPSFTEETRNG